MQYRVSADYILFGKKKNKALYKLVLIFAFIDLHMLVFMPILAKIIHYYDASTFGSWNTHPQTYLREYPLNIILTYLIIIFIAELTYLLFTKLKRALSENTR